MSTRIEWLERIAAAARLHPGLVGLVNQMDEELAHLENKARLDKQILLAEKIQDQLKTLDDILLWAEDNPQFSPEYILKLRSWVSQGNALSEGQEIAVENIVEKWRVES